MKFIAIDAGHGGTDPGAVNGSRQEKDDVLKMAIAVRRLLEQQGQRVLETRPKDVFVALTERSNIANQANVDLFVSIHRNSFSSAAANGVETWVQSGSPVTVVQYARRVQNELIGVGAQSDRGVKQGNYSVLRKTRAPSMLVEVGFISNAKDNQLFDQQFDAYALAITKGILASLNQPYTEEEAVPVAAAPVTPATPTAPAAPAATVPAGDPIIASLQNTLNARYNTGLAEDGKAGTKTKTALVVALQQELNKSYNAGLATDGKFGAKTKAAIRALKRGAKGELVYLLQAALYLKGYQLKLDGSFGAATETVVKTFQKKSGLAVDGSAGPATFEKLFKTGRTTPATATATASAGASAVTPAPGPAEPEAPAQEEEAPPAAPAAPAFQMVHANAYWNKMFSPYMAFIKEASDLFLTPYPKAYATFIKAVIYRESRGDARLDNGICAGLLQLHKDYWLDWKAAAEKASGRKLKDRFDPESNIIIGTWFLSQKLKTAHGDPFEAVLRFTHGDTGYMKKKAAGTLNLRYANDVVDNMQRIQEDKNPTLR